MIDICVCQVVFLWSVVLSQLGLACIGAWVMKQVNQMHAIIQLGEAKLKFCYPTFFLYLIIIQSLQLGEYIWTASINKSLTIFSNWLKQAALKKTYFWTAFGVGSVQEVADHTAD